MKRGLLIYNPASGDQRVPAKLDSILARFQDGGILMQPFRTKPQGDDLRDILLSSIYDLLVVSGGDGSLNMVVNLMRTCGIKLPIGVLPTGTCNDFARGINLPNNIEACVDIILAGNMLEVDLGLVNNDRLFVATCGGGTFIDASYLTDSDFKRSFGPIAYYLNALNDVVNKRTFQIDLETETLCVRESDVLMFLIMNGTNAGGFTGVVKEADMSDGLMDIILIKNCGPIDMADMFFKVLWQDIQQNRNVMVLKAQRCRIASDVDIPLSIDGEFGGHLPLEITFENKALTVYAPKK